MRINNPMFQKISAFIDKFFHTNIYLALVMAVGVIGFSINGGAVPTMFILLIFIAANLAFSRDIMPAFVATVLITLIPMNSANKPLDEYLVLAYAAIALVPAIVVRFYVYPPKLIKGENFLPLLLYSIALLLGGLGSSLAPQEYFGFIPIYTMLGLGFLQLIMYLFWQNYIPNDNGRNVDYFCRMMICISVTALLIMTVSYLKEIPYFQANGFKILYFSWKNYLSDIFMLTMPFSFYFAVKRRNKVVYLALGMLQYLAVVISISGGGIVFASLMMPFLIIYTVFKSERNDRIKVIIILVILLIPILVLIGCNFDAIIKLFDGKIESGGSSRTTIWAEAWRVFKEYPFFGGGFGHTNTTTMLMYYYHSSLFSALGATGIIGTLAYFFMAFRRFKTYLKRNLFNVFLVIGFLGFAGYSMIDVGEAIPFPFVMMCTFMMVLCEKNTSFERYGHIEKKDYSKLEYGRM